MVNIATGGRSLIDVEAILHKSGLTEKMKTADLGCGSSGHLLFGAARVVGRNGRIYAVDILKNLLENIAKQARAENMPQIKTVWSNLEVFAATKIENNSLDVAFLVNTLYQASQRVEMLRESRRMLKPEGKLVLVEWKNIALPFGPPPEKRVDWEQLKTGCQKLNLRLEEEFEAGKYHYGLILSKVS